MTGSEYIAEFLVRIGSRHVFTLTGGACAFMIDAVGRHPDLKIVCVQNEQAAAMAADAVWRVDRRLGVTMATSGPGATNLITGIACSFFDSIPSLHITGQVNQRESRALHGAKVRQAGFQETKIVEMVRPITKYAVLITEIEHLGAELAKAYAIATSGRMGPVLIDVPMDIQQAEIEPVFPALPTIVEDGRGPIGHRCCAGNLRFVGDGRASCGSLGRWCRDGGRANRACEVARGQADSICRKLGRAFSFPSRSSRVCRSDRCVRQSRRQFRFTECGCGDCFRKPPRQPAAFG